jgi:hypothetical protein
MTDADWKMLILAGALFIGLVVVVAHGDTCTNVTRDKWDVCTTPIERTAINDE